MIFACGELKPVPASSSVREGDWNVLFGENTSEMNEMTRLRTDRSADGYGEYVRRVAAIWFKYAKSPGSLVTRDLCFFWSVSKSQTLRVHSVAQEFLLTCFVWVHEDLLQQKAKSRSQFIEDLILAARVVRWLMLPVSKLLRISGAHFALTFSGCTQLLALCLVELIHQCVLRAESRGLTDDSFLGMAEWVIRIALRLTKLGNIDLKLLIKQMRALQILYVTPDSQDHDLALGQEAVMRFMQLNDPVRLKKARLRILEHSGVLPTDKHKPIQPVGPSDLKVLDNPNIWKSF